jgi:hypothetical protein
MQKYGIIKYSSQMSKVEAHRGTWKDYKAEKRRIWYIVCIDELSEDVLWLVR